MIQSLVSVVLFSDMFQHCFENKKILTTYLKYGCKLKGIENCILNCNELDIDEKELKLCPEPVPIVRENTNEYMKYEPFNMKNVITKDTLNNFGLCNPYRDMSKLFIKNRVYSFENDLPFIDGVHPEEITGPVTMTPQTMELIENFLKTNPTTPRSAFGFWIKQLKGVKCNNFCVNKFNKTVESFIMENINEFVRYEPFVNSINCNLEHIVTSHCRLRSLLTEIMDNFPQTSLKFVMDRVKTLMNDTIKLRNNNNNIQLRPNVLQEVNDSDDKSENEIESESEYETESEIEKESEEEN